VRLRQAAADMDLDAHERRIEAMQRAAVDDGEGHAVLNPPRRRLVDEQFRDSGGAPSTL
jgi:hypothetical protein